MDSGWDSSIDGNRGLLAEILFPLFALKSHHPDSYPLNQPPPVSFLSVEVVAGRGA